MAIDLLSIQNEIDKHALYQLDEKTEKLLEKKEEDYLKYKKIYGKYNKYIYKTNCDS